MDETAPAHPETNGPAGRPAGAPVPSPGRFTRRRLFLLGAGAGLAGLGACRFGGYPAAARLAGLGRLSPVGAAILAAVVEAVLPPGADRSPARIEAHVRAIDAYLAAAGAPPEDVRDLHALLYALEHLTLPLGGRLRRFTSLEREGRAAVLEGLRASRFGVLRFGLRSLVTLVFLAHYRDDAAFAPIGYPGPVVPGFEGPPESRARYDALLAPPDREPAIP